MIRFSSILTTLKLRGLVAILNRSLLVILFISSLFMNYFSTHSIISALLVNAISMLSVGATNATILKELKVDKMQFEEYRSDISKVLKYRHLSLLSSIIVGFVVAFLFKNIDLYNIILSL